MDGGRFRFIVWIRIITQTKILITRTKTEFAHPVRLCHGPTTNDDLVQQPKNPNIRVDPTDLTCLMSIFVRSEYEWTWACNQIQTDCDKYNELKAQDERSFHVCCVQVPSFFTNYVRKLNKPIRHSLIKNLKKKPEKSSWGSGRLAGSSNTARCPGTVPQSHDLPRQVSRRYKIFLPLW